MSSSDEGSVKLPDIDVVEESGDEARDEQTFGNRISFYPETRSMCDQHHMFVPHFLSNTASTLSFLNSSQISRTIL
uniref:CTNNB1_binding domain-containing protein n=1 Tax=Meloidogyne hapla TaxID=6305 RepID=A0A1I8B477_MELHA